MVNKLESVETLQSRCMHLSLVFVWQQPMESSRECVGAEAGF
jgi:hypothetical protein